ncbi:MAG: ABC transporter permease [Ancalomicrobiaceae bacterium]|nr:ABC transporter permease [Ancalomicrobiaceae bacterium]
MLLDNITYVVFAAVTVFFMAVAPNFASFGTAEAILRVTALVSIMAVGMSFVIICAEIDLSVGSVASWSGMLVAMLLEAGVPVQVAPIIALLGGGGIGLLTGLLVTKLHIPSFLVTLGMLSVFSGLSLTVTTTMPVPIIDADFADVLWNGDLIGVPAPIWWTLITVLVGFYLLHYTVFGRRVFAVGGGVTAARFSGIKTDQTKIWAFVLSGMTASLAGMMLAARSSAGNPSLGQGLELDVIAAVIIGGTSLFGGYGSILGAVVGAVFIGTLGFGLLVMGLSSSIQEVIKGIIIIAAVALNRRR